MKFIVHRLSFIVFLLFCLAPGTWHLTPALHADRRQTSGFETNNLLATEWTGAPSGASAFVTTPVHSGTYALEINRAAGDEYVRRSLVSNTAGATWFLTSHIRIATAPDATIDVQRTMSGTTVAAAQMQINSSRNVLIRNNVTATAATSSTVLATNTWYRLELKHVSLDAAGSIEGKIFEDMAESPLETLNITGEDTQNVDVRSFDFGKAGADTTVVIYFDDIAVNQSTGTFETGYPGAFKIALLKPASDDTVTWTQTGANCAASTNTNCVDDEPGVPDDASGYNMSATANQEDRLNSTTLPAEVPSDADMISLTVYDRWDGNGNTGTRTGRHLIWDEASAQTNGPTHARCDVAAGNWSIPTPGQITVFDLGTRTKANVEAFDLGYEPIDSAECRVTAIWGNVAWKPSAAAVTGMRRRAIVFE